MEDLSFSHNWNNKLDCRCFTTLRLLSAKWSPGQQVNIKLKGESKGIGIIAAIRKLELNQINEYIARIDTGYSAKECKEIIRKMYPNVDFSEQLLGLMLIIKK